MPVKTVGETFWTLNDLLARGAPFAYTRFGDGEMEIVLGGGGGGQSPSPALARETFDLFNWRDEPRNVLGLARHRDEPMTAGVFQSWSNPRYDSFDVPHTFEHATALHAYAYHRPGVLRAFFDRLRDRPKVYVGALDGPELVDLWGDYQHLEIPERDAYSTIGTWYPKLEEAVKYCPLVLFAVGPAKCAATLRLLQTGRYFQSLDLGSVVDFALGETTRTWIMQAQAKP